MVHQKCLYGKCLASSRRLTADLQVRPLNLAFIQICLRYFYSLPRDCTKTFFHESLISKSCILPSNVDPHIQPPPRFGTIFCIIPLLTYLLPDTRSIGEGGGLWRKRVRKLFWKNSVYIQPFDVLYRILGIVLAHNTAITDSTTPNPPCQILHSMCSA